MSGQPLPNPGTPVRWEMDGEQAADLGDALSLLEDFLRQASSDAVDELAGFCVARPLDPSIWVDWLADYLGDQVAALRAATHAATAALCTGDPS